MRKTSLNCVHNLAKADSRVVFIGSDLGPGVLDEMRQEFPERFFMEGVAEQHIIGLAAGLALEGFVPYVNTIATFLTRRCLEQIAIDLCMHDLPVRLIANGGGCVYAPLGPTHLATDDFALLRVLPNIGIVAPCDAEEMQRLMNTTLDWPHPLYIRLAKGGDRVISKGENGFELGKSIVMEMGSDAVVISTGIMTQVAIDARRELAKEGVSVGVLHVHTIKPLDIDGIAKAVGDVGLAVVIEEHSCIGGLGSAVLDGLCDEAPALLPKITRMALPDQFADEYGSQESLNTRYGLTSKNLINKIKAGLEHGNVPI